MSFEEIMSELKAGKFKPVYFLTGEEPYFIDRITSYVAENALRAKLFVSYSGGFPRIKAFLAAKRFGT